MKIDRDGQLMAERLSVVRVSRAARQQKAGGAPRPGRAVIR